MKPAIIIPTYNEEENIEKLVDLIFINLKNTDFGIIFVDDSSSDNTVSNINNAIKKYDNIFLLQRPAKMGLASAYIDGFKKAKELNYTHAIEMDADLSHNPKYLVSMIENLKNYDVVIGSRYVKGGSTPDWGIVRKMISFGGSLYSKVILNCPINDLTGGFNGWKLDLLDKIGLDNIISKGYCFQIEMKYRAFKSGASIKEFPIEFKDRTFGKSKMSKAIFFEALINTIKLRLMVR